MLLHPQCYCCCAAAFAIAVTLVIAVQQVSGCDVASTAPPPVLFGICASRHGNQAGHCIAMLVTAVLYLGHIGVMLIVTFSQKHLVIAMDP